jgi:hypothetical protein
MRRTVYRDAAVVFILVFCLSLLACKTKEQNVCDSGRQSLLAVVAELDRLTVSLATGQGSAGLTKEGEASVKLQVQRLNDVEDLVGLARISRALSLHDRDSCLENRRVYDAAYWECIKMLASKKTDLALEQMKRLFETSELGEPEREYFRQFLPKN